MSVSLLFAVPAVLPKRADDEVLQAPFQKNKAVHFLLPLTTTELYTRTLCHPRRPKEADDSAGIYFAFLFSEMTKNSHQMRL